MFSSITVGRAVADWEGGAGLYWLHKHPWWQTPLGPLLDAGAFVVGLEYATGTMATVLGKPSASYFEAALEALDADPEHAWMVGDDIDADIGGAAALGMHTILVRTGKFRDDAGAWSAQPEAVVDSIADVPDLLERAGS
jgi:ribonucleotide monophosphatase NagD (HAD superfamily)